MSGSPKFTLAWLTGAHEQRLRQRRTASAAAEKARRQAAEERRRAERLAQLRGEVAGELAALRQKAGPVVAGQLDRAEADLKSATTAAEVRQVRKQLRALSARRGQWNEERDRCQAALTDLTDRIAGLRADPVVCRWASERVDALEREAVQVQALIDAGQLAAAGQRTSALGSQIDEVIAAAQESQLREDRRNYIVDGLLQVMNEMGFVVQAGSPAPEDPGVPASATIIHARRIGGGALAVSIPQDGPIWYDVGDFPMRVEQVGGQPVRTCDEAEQQIEQMHKALAEAFGIETNGVQWEGKPVDPVRKQAERLPDVQPRQQRHEGGS